MYIVHSNSLIEKKIKQIQNLTGADYMSALFLIKIASTLDNILTKQIGGSKKEDTDAKDDAKDNAKDDAPKDNTKDNTKDDAKDDDSDDKDPSDSEKESESDEEDEEPNHFQKVYSKLTLFQEIL